MIARPNVTRIPAHRQFTSTSPMALSETLNRQTTVLSNGAVGIDFRYLAAPNLANSEVLKMLEEEEKGKTGLKRVAWPPPPEQPNVVGLPAQGTYDFQQPPTVNTNFGNQQGIPKAVSANPAAYSQQRSVPPPWENGPAGYQPVQPPQQAPPPATMAMRSEAPTRQIPVQTIISQPVMKRQAPLRMRGDQKWPPENYKQLKELENIPKGPLMRPSRQRKDYSSFFSQNALNATYPGYRAPPGTQHYIEEGTSNL